VAVHERSTRNDEHSSPQRVLIVEDEPDSAEIVRRHLVNAGYETVVERDGLTALARVATWRPHLLVLDVMLPGLDGLEVLRRLRAGAGRRIAVILVSAMSEEEDRICGLELGADDYLPKPFSAAELVARVGAVLRRTIEGDDRRAAPLSFEGLGIDPVSREVRADGHLLSLTQREFDLLLFMAARPGQVVTREQLMDAVWRFQFYSDTTTVTVHVRRLRAKIERDPSEPKFIETVRGVGYRFRP